MAEGTDVLAQEEWSLHVLAEFLFHFYLIRAPAHLDGTAHIQDESFPLAVFPHLLWKHPQRHTWKCALLTP
jgi:hypothetical protein